MLAGVVRFSVGALGVVLLCVATLLSGCGSPGKGDFCIVGDTLPMRYASLLEIVECDSFSVVDVKSPWRDALLHRYILVPKGKTIPANMPEGSLLRTPLDKALLFSAVHVNLFSSLGCLEAVKGVCDAQYMLMPEVHEGIADGRVVDCGGSLDVDVERVCLLAPEAVFAFPFENGGYGKIEKLNIPVVECAEYMETSPLAAAEWARFYGRLLGCGHVADSLFDAVCDNFEHLRAMVDTCTGAPTLMCELKSSSAWYVPAGGSTMGQMYKMAGAEYLFAYTGGSGSVPLAYEVVLDKAVEADKWLFKYNSRGCKTLSSLLADFPGYARFRAFKNGEVYACNTAVRPFYEETPFRPDLLLKELMAIFYPSLFPEYNLRYYEKLQR